MTAALRFFVLIEVLGLAATPLAAVAFARLPGRGVAFAKPLGLLVATALTAVFGLITGAIILHTQGVTLLMLTLAIVTLLYEAVNRASHLTGGDDGLQGITIAPLFGEAIHRIADESSVSSLFD